MSETQPERLSQEDIQARFDNSPFISTLGLRVTALDYAAQELTVEMPLKPERPR